MGPLAGQEARDGCSPFEIPWNMLAGIEVGFGLEEVDRPLFPGAEGERYFGGEGAACSADPRPRDSPFVQIVATERGNP